MKWPRFLQGSTTPPPRLLDEDEQSPAAALLRAARLNGPPPPAGAQERAMAALDRAAAEAAETVQEAPDGAKVFEGTRRPRRWSRIVQGVAIAAAAMLPLWLWARQSVKQGQRGAVDRLDAEPLIIRQPNAPQSGPEPIVAVSLLGCGDARRLVRLVDIVYPREAIAAGVEADMLVSCDVSQEGAFERCRDVQAPANAKIDAAEVLRSVGTWRYAIPESERALLSSTCTLRIQFQLRGRP